MNFFVTALTLVSFLSLSQCSEECDEARIRTLLANPPSEWDVNQLTKEDIDDFICSKALVTATVDCLEDSFNCDSVEGMGHFVDEIYSRIDEGNNCSSCDPEIMDLLIESVRVVQKRFPKQYTRGLAFF